MLIGVVGLRRGTVVTAYDASDGHTSWRRVLPPDVLEPTAMRRNRSAETNASVTVDHGLVAVAEDVAGLRVLDLRTGALLWTAEPRSSDFSAQGGPTVAITADAIYYSSPLHTTTTSVRRLDRTTGALRWERQAGGSVAASGGVVLTRHACELQAWSATDGAPLWDRVGSGSCESNGPGPVPTVARGLVLDTTGPVVLRDLDDGTSVATFAATPGQEVLGTTDDRWVMQGWHGVAAYADDGTPAWRLPQSRERRGAAVVGDVVLTTEAPEPASLVAPPTVTTIRALDADTGNELSRWAPRWGTVSPHTVGGRGLVGSTLVEPGPVGPHIAPATTSEASTLWAPSWTNARAVDLPFVPDASGDAECRRDDDAWTACSSPWRTPDLGPDGEHVLEVRGPGGSPPVRRTVVVDRTPPIVTITDRPTDPVGREEETDIDFTADEPDVTFLCRVDPAPSSTRPGDTCNSGFNDYAGLGDGPHVLEVRARDRAGNIGPAVQAPWTENRHGPRVTVSGPTGRVESRSFDIDFSVEDEDPVQVTCWSSRGSAEPREERGCTSPWRVEAPKPGTYRYGVTAVDQAGNTISEEGGPVLAVTAEDVVVAPRFALTSAGGPGRHWGREIQAENTAFAAVAGQRMDMRCRFDDGPTWVPCDGQVFIPGEGGMEPREGEHVVEMQGVMHWGLAGPILRVRFGIDRTRPVLRFEGGTTGSVRPDAAITPPRPVLDAAGPDEGPQDGSIVCTANVWHSGPTCGPTVIAPSNWDSVTFSARTTDAAGNTATVERRVAISPTADPAPDPDPDPTPGPGTGTDSSTGPDSGTGGQGPGGAWPPAPGGTDGHEAAPLVPSVPWRDPRATAPAVTDSPVATPPAGTPGSRACRDAAGRGARRPSLVAMRLERGGLVARIRTPGATRRRPVTVTVEVRKRCGAWRAVHTSRRRTASGRVSTGRLPADVTAVRVRTSSGAARAVSAERALPR